MSVIEISLKWLNSFSERKLKYWSKLFAIITTAIITTEIIQLKMAMIEIPVGYLELRDLR